MSSGVVLSRFQVLDGIPPLSSFAPLTRRNNHFIGLFDATAPTTLDFEDVLDRGYSGGVLTIVLAWRGVTATAGAVKWNAQVERHQASVDDPDADSFAAAQTATGTTAG